MIRTTKTEVTFLHPFWLSDINRLQPAGSYLIETDEEPIRELSFSAYRRVATRITVADPDRLGCIEEVDIDPAELATALARDGGAGAHPQDMDNKK